MSKNHFSIILCAWLLIVLFFVAPVAQAAVIPNDPGFKDAQWYLDKIRATDAWHLSTGSHEVVVAVIDTGIDYTHPDLAGNIWLNPDDPLDGRDNDGNTFVDDRFGWDFLDNDNDPAPNPTADDPIGATQHGTIIAGLIGATGDNTTATAGLAWKVRIMPLRALNNFGEGKSTEVAKAIDYAIAKGAQVINLSFVGNEEDPLLISAVARAYEAGLVVVAAAGNDSSSPEGGDLDRVPRFPVCTKGPVGERWLLGVSAVDREDRKTSQSNYGKNCIAVVAPGSGLFSTLALVPRVKGFDRSWGGKFSGTSVAAALVSGTAALLKAYRPSLTNAQIMDAIVSTAVNVDAQNSAYTGALGAGRIDVFAALGSVRAAGEEEAAHAMMLLLPGAKGSQMLFLDHEGNVTETREVAIPFSRIPSLAVGDIERDGNPEIFIGAPPGMEPRVWVMRRDGTRVSSFLVGDRRDRRGVGVAAGDFDFDGKDEIAAAVGVRGGAEVRMFDPDGVRVRTLKAPVTGLAQGAEIAYADLDGDGIQEFVLGARKGSVVAVVDRRGILEASWVAYAQGTRLGVRVAVADLNDDGVREIVVAPGEGGGPHVRIFTDKGHLINQFFAYEKQFRGGVSLALEDIDGDGVREIITASGPGRTPELHLFSARGDLSQNLRASFGDKKRGIGVVVVPSAGL